MVVARAVAHGDQAGHAAAGDELAADQVAGALGGDEQRVDALRAASTWPKWMLKPCEHISMLPGFRFGLISFAIDVALHFVGQQDVDRRRPAWWRRRRDIGLKPWLIGEVVVRAAGPLADDRRSQPLSRRFWAWAWPCEP